MRAAPIRMFSKSADWTTDPQNGVEVDLAGVSSEGGVTIDYSAGVDGTGTETLDWILWEIKDSAGTWCELRAADGARMGYTVSKDTERLYPTPTNTAASADGLWIIPGRAARVRAKFASLKTTYTTEPIINVDAMPFDFRENSMRPAPINMFDQSAGWSIGNTQGAEIDLTGVSTAGVVSIDYTAGDSETMDGVFFEVKDSTGTWCQVVDGGGSLRKIVAASGNPRAYPLESNSGSSANGHAVLPGRAVRAVVDFSVAIGTQPSVRVDFHPFSY